MNHCFPLIYLSTMTQIPLLSCYLPPYNLVVSKLLEKNLLTNKLFVGKAIKDMWEHFVTIFVHQCPRPVEISLKTAEVFEEHGMMKEVECLRGECSLCTHVCFN